MPSNQFQYSFHIYLLSAGALDLIVLDNLISFLCSSIVNNEQSILMYDQWIINTLLDAQSEEPALFCLKQLVVMTLFLVSFFFKKKKHHKNINFQLFHKIRKQPP